MHLQQYCICLWFVLKLATMMTAVTLSVETPAETESVVLLIRRTGARATPARVRVLQLLRVAPAALTRHEIEQALADQALDRVTLYRVLEWLVESGFACWCVQIASWGSPPTTPSSSRRRATHDAAPRARSEKDEGAADVSAAEDADADGLRHG